VEYKEKGRKCTRLAPAEHTGQEPPMFDCETSGIDGAKEALWFFAERILDVRLAWTHWMHGGKFVGRQPEVSTDGEWGEILGRLT